MRAPQWLKFCIIGGINTCFGYAMYALFLFIGMSYSFALLLATCIGIIFNFKTTGTLVFEAKTAFLSNAKANVPVNSYPNTLSSDSIVSTSCQHTLSINKFFLKFIAVYLGVYLCNLALVKGFFFCVHNFYIAGFLAVFPSAILSFLANKHYVFKGTRHEAH